MPNSWSSLKLKIYNSHPSGNLVGPTILLIRASTAVLYDLSKVKSFASDTIKVRTAETSPTNVKNRKCKKKRKESRQKRLLKYQEKLVKRNGVPPSRLMMEREILVGRNQSEEFEQVDGFESGTAVSRPASEPCQDTRLHSVTVPLSQPISYLPPHNTSRPPPITPAPTVLMPGQIGSQPFFCVCMTGQKASYVIFNAISVSTMHH